MRPLLSIDLLVPSKEKKMLFSFVTKQKPPTPETTFRKKQGSPSSPILEHVVTQSRKMGIFANECYSVCYFIMK